MELLSDTDTYALINNPINELIKKNRLLVEKMFVRKYIDKDTKDKLINAYAHLPRIHGLPKLHKENIPMRPVVDTINSPAYELCKFMNDILKNIIDQSKYNIKNTYEFKEFITQVKIPKGHKLVSYDARSLYTNTDIDSVIEDLRNKWALIEEHTNIDKELFFEILDFCLCQNVYFTYQDKTYRQIAGLAMGLSLACTIADLYLTEMFDKSIPKLSFKPEFVKKFIDDIISTAPENKIIETRDIFNAFDPRGRLEFTYEMEENNKINFLDMTLIHMIDHKVKTNWFCKETSSNRIINFLSTHPPKMKLNIAIEFTNRVLALSDPIFKPKNIERIKDILRKNNYPERIIHKAIEIVKHKQDQRKQQIQSQQSQPPLTNPDIIAPTERTYRSMMYIPRLTREVNKQLRIANPTLTIAPKPTKQLNHCFTKTKTKIPKQEQTDALYRIKCKTNICPEPFYLGETERTPKKRTSEHKTDFKNRFKPGNKTALIEHTLDYPGHEPDLEIENVIIIDRENNTFKRKLLESCYINLYGSKANNFKRDAQRLNENYSNILNIYKSIHNP